MRDHDWSSTGDEAVRSLAAMWAAGSAELIALARRFDLSLASLAVLGDAAAGSLGAWWARLSGETARAELAEIGLEVRLLARALAELDRRQRLVEALAEGVALSDLLEGRDLRPGQVPPLRRAIEGERARRRILAAPERRAGGPERMQNPAQKRWISQS